MVLRRKPSFLVIVIFVDVEVTLIGVEDWSSENVVDEESDVHEDEEGVEREEVEVGG